jgi:hypothetical protein
MRNILHNSSENNLHRIVDCFRNADLLRSLFKLTAKNVPHEANLIVALFELHMLFFSMFFMNKSFIKKQLDFSEHFNEQDLYFKAVKILTEWISKEFRDSTLVNFGLDSGRKRSLMYKVLVAPNQSKSGGFMNNLYNMFGTSQAAEARTFKEFELDELLVYAILLRISLPIDDKDALAYYQYTILNILRSRLIESNDLESILRTRTAYKFQQLNQQGNYVVNVFDSVIVESYMMKKPEHVETACKLLMERIPILQKYTSAFFDLKIKNVKNKLEFVLSNDEFVILLSYHYQSLSRKNDSPIAPERRDNFLVYLIGGLIEASNKLIGGSLDIETVQAINKHVNAAYKILNLVNANDRVMVSRNVCVAESASFRQVLKQRVREVDEFKKYQQNLTSFIQICSKLKGINSSLF